MVERPKTISTDDSLCRPNQDEILIRLKNEISLKIADKKAEIRRYKELAAGIQGYPAIQTPTSPQDRSPGTTCNHRGDHCVEGNSEGLRLLDELALRKKELQDERTRAIDLSRKLDLLRHDVETAQAEELRTRSRNEALKVQSEASVRLNDRLLDILGQMQRTHENLTVQIGETKSKLDYTERESTRLRGEMQSLREALEKTNTTNRDIEKTIVEVNNETESIEQQIKELHIERERLQNEIDNNTQKVDMLRKSQAQDKHQFKILSKKLKEIENVRDKVDFVRDDMSRKLARAVKIEEGLMRENATLRTQLIERKTRERITKKDLVRKGPIVQDEDTTSKKDETCQTLESTLASLKQQIKNLEDSGTLDETGRLKAITISNPDTDEIVARLGVNEKLLEAQALEDNDKCIEMIVGIIANILECDEHR